MNKIFVVLGSLVLVAFSTLVVSQQVTEPMMTLQSYGDVEPGLPADGRKVRRVMGSTTGLIRVEWPAGTTTTPHNHANELVLTVVEGRLRAISGDREFIMEPGDTAVIPAWVEHGYVALEDTLTYEATGPG